MHHPFKSYSVDKSSQELEPEAEEAASAASQSNKGKNLVKKVRNVSEGHYE